MSRLFPKDANEDRLGGRLQPQSQDAGIRDFYRDVMGEPGTAARRRPGDVQPARPSSEG